MESLSGFPVSEDSRLWIEPIHLHSLFCLRLISQPYPHPFSHSPPPSCRLHWTQPLWRATTPYHRELIKSLSGMKLHSLWLREMEAWYWFSASTWAFDKLSTSRVSASLRISDKIMRRASLRAAFVFHQARAAFNMQILVTREEDSKWGKTQPGE